MKKEQFKKTSAITQLARPNLTRAQDYTFSVGIVGFKWLSSQNILPWRNIYVRTNNKKTARLSPLFAEKT